jgi:hypothetical protein
VSDTGEGPGFQAPPCDPEVFKTGKSIIVLSGWTRDIEPWVQSIAAASGQPVDWHFSGGRANVLYLGDRAKVEQAIRDNPPGPKVQVLGWVGELERGPYRAGDPLPDGVLAVVS